MSIERKQEGGRGERGGISVFLYPDQQLSFPFVFSSSQLSTNLLDC